MKQRYFLLLLAVVGCGTIYADIATPRINKNLTIYNDVMRQLDMNYADTLNYDDLTETAINQMLHKIDPYTVYIPKREDEDLKMMTTGNYGGIGAVIMQRDSDVYINEPYAGMPAAENDVRAGDKIIKVDTMLCHNKTTKQVSDQLRGKPGTTVRLVLEREGEEKPIVREFQRREIHLPAVTYASALPYEGKQYGYILFSEFTSGSAQDFLVEVDKMVTNSHIQGLIIDLRSNGGGIIDEAIKIVSYFVPKGTTVVTTKGKTDSSNRTYATSTSPIWKDLPIIILVNGQSASAAEIVSGSLQELHRATLIGERTFGKGLVQSIRPIAFDGHIKVTTAHYYLPSGRCIQAIDYSERQKGNQLKKDTAGGILPDIVMDDSDKVNITYALYKKHMFFDYATRYHRYHDSIAPATRFELSDDELEGFIMFLDAKGFTYETETANYMKELIDIAKHEDLDSTQLALLDSVREVLQPSFRTAIYRHRDEVKRALGTYIVERYYFQQGKVAFIIRDDKQIKRALEELSKHEL